MAIFNFCDYTRFITDMTSETFGLYVGVIYIQKGVELIIREFDRSSTDGWLGVVVAMLFALSVYWLEKAGRKGACVYVCKSTFRLLESSFHNPSI